MAAERNVKNTQRVSKTTKPLITPNWTEPEGLTPFYDHDNKRYSVTIELGYESVAPNSRFRKTGYPNEYITAGVNKILEFYNKDPGNKGPLELGSAVEFYVPERPRAKVKVLVTIEESVFDELNVNQKPVTTATREISIDSKNFNQRIGGIVNILNEYQKEIEKLDGKIYGFEFDQQASLLQNFEPALSKLVRDNGYLYDNAISEQYTFGVDNQYDIKYVQIFKNEKYQRLNNNFGLFKESNPIKDTQTVYLVDKVAEIYGSYKSTPKMNWEDFLKKYSIKEYNVTYGETRTFNPTKDGANEKIGEDANSKPLKTNEQAANEQKKLASINRLQTYDRRSKIRENVENGILGNIRKTENSLTDLESMYFQFLHRYQITPLVKQAIICLDPNGEIARRYAQIKQFLRDADNFIQGVIDILKIPSIELPDFSTTIHIMKDIGAAIIQAVLDALYSALIQLGKDILQMIVESCGNPDAMNFGGYNIKDIFSDGSIATGLLVGNYAAPAVLGGISSGITDVNNFDLDASKNIVNNMRSFINNAAVQRFVVQGAFGPNGDFSRMFDEVSSILTPGEIARLLRDGGSPTVKTSVYRMISDDQNQRFSQDFKDFFNSEDKVEDFFSSFGRLVDENALLEKIQEVQDIGYTPLGGLCSGTDENLRRALLENKGLSKSEIDKQISDASERRRKRLEELSSLLEKDNLLDGVLPPLYCSVDENGNVKPGLIDLDHPSFTFMLDRTVNTVYDNVHSTFLEDANNLIPSLKQTLSTGQREIKRVKLKPNWIEVQNYNQNLPEGAVRESLHMINPEFEIYYAQGFRSVKDFPYPYVAELEGTPQTIVTRDSNGDLVETEAGEYENRNLSPDPDAEAVLYNKLRVTGRESETSIFVPITDDLLAPGLKDNLENISITGSSMQGVTNFKFEEGNPRNFNLIIPDLTTQIVSQNLPVGGSISSTQEAQSVMKTLEENLSDTFTSFPTDVFNVREIKLKYEPDPSLSENTDSFTFSIYSVFGGQEKEVYSSKSIKQLDKKSNDYIIGTNLFASSYSNINADNFSDQEKLFNSLLKDCFKNGPTNALKKEDGYERMSFEHILEVGEDVREATLDANNQIQFVLENNPVIVAGAGTDLELDYPIPILNEKQTSELETLYREILRDYMTTVSDFTSESIFFDKGEYDLVNLTPDLSDQKRLSGCADPHLLDLESIKNIIKQQYERNKCVERNEPDSDGLGTNRDNALESSLIAGSVVATIRLYVIEVILKSIWSFSEFRYKKIEDVDVALVDYIRVKMVDEIWRRQYLPDFVFEAVKIYERLTKLNDNLQKIGTITQENVYNPTTRALSGESILSLNYLIKAEFWTMCLKIALIIDEEQDISLDSRILDTMIPLYDVVSNIYESRLSLENPKFLNNLAEIERILLETGLSQQVIDERKSKYLNLDESNPNTNTYADVIEFLGAANVRVNTLNAQGQQVFPIASERLYDQFSLLPNPSTDNSKNYNLQQFVQSSRFNRLMQFLNPTYRNNTEGQDEYQRILPVSASDVPPLTSWPASLNNPGINTWPGDGGIKNTYLWREDISKKELKAIGLMHEIFNDPNVLPPGNAGSSFTVPKYKDQSETILDTWNWINAPFGEETQPIYKLVELPYSKQPINAGNAFLYGRFLGPEYGSVYGEPSPGYGSTPGTGYDNLFQDKIAGATYYSGPDVRENGPRKVNSPAGLANQNPSGVGTVNNGFTVGDPTYLSSLENDPNDRYQRALSGISDEDPAEVLEELRRKSAYDPTINQPYFFRKKQPTDLHPGPSPIDINQPSNLPEYSWHPRMTQYNIQDATIYGLYDDIQKEISYYKEFRRLMNVNDRRLYRFVHRQFDVNRMWWTFSVSEKRRLDKIIEDATVRFQWRGKPLFAKGQLDDILESIHLYDFIGYIQSPTQEGVVLQGINRGPTNQNAIKENGQLAFPGAMTFVDILNQVARRLENLVYDEAQGKDYRKLPLAYATFEMPTQNINVDGVRRNRFWVGTNYRTINQNGGGDWGHPSTPTDYREGRWAPTLLNRVNRLKARMPGTYDLFFGAVPEHRRSSISDLLYNFDTTLDPKFLGSTPPYPGETPMKVSMLEYYLWWELDWWLSKMTSFMLLNDELKEARVVKDYPDYLNELSLRALEVKDLFSREIDEREAAREEVLEQLGGVLDTKTPKGQPLTSFNSNGNIILEKYVKIKDRDWESLIEDAHTQGNVKDRERYKEYRNLIKNRGSNLQGVVKLEDFQNYINQFYTNNNTVIGEYNTSKIDNTKKILKSFYEPTAPDESCGTDLTRYIEERLPNLTPQTLLSELFEELSFGLRLTCISAPNSRLSQYSETFFNYGSIENTDRYKKAVNRDKAYYLHEIGIKPGNETLNISEEQINDKYMSIPIVYSEKKIDLLETTIEDLAGEIVVNNPLVNIPLAPIQKMDHLYMTNYMEIRENLKNSDQFDLLYKYLVPVNRFLSLVTIYNLTYIGTNEEPARVFNRTKDSLKLVFLSGIRSGNYLATNGPGNRILSQRGPDPYGVDLAALAKNFGLMVVKTLTEVVDPNIKLSRFIYESAKKGTSIINEISDELSPPENECENSDLVNLPPGTLASISATLALFGVPITLLGIPYLPIFGFVDPLESKSDKDLQRKIQKCEPGKRDYTKAEECSTDNSSSQYLLGDGQEPEEQ
jgi:hypothetical protein